jgi:hypothetical protein
VNTLSGATLLSPPNGSTNVDPNAEILISFRGAPQDDWERLVFIKVDGEIAVFGGQDRDPFRTTKIQRVGEFAYWGLRRVGGLRCRDIVVQAMAGPEACSVDQRFFVSGAKASVFHNITDRVLVEQWMAFGLTAVCVGSIHVQGDRFPVPTTWERPHLIAGKKTIVVYEDPGVIVTLTKRGMKTTWVPRAWLSSAKKVVGASLRSGGWWVGILSESGTLTVITNKSSHQWEVAATDVHVSENFVHLDLGTKSAHLPLDYEPTPHERFIDSWYQVEQPPHGRLAFSDDFCVWWRPERMVSRHRFSPFMGDSDDMLWTKDDIGEEFAEVGIVDSHHVLVNGHLYLNTLYPEVVRL